MAAPNKDFLNLNLQGSIPRLQDYSVSPTLGFMRENPLHKLPEYFDPWWKIVTRIPELVEDGTLRDEVTKMPFLDYRKLDGEPEWRLGHVVLSAITQTYVWVAGEKHIPLSLPKNLAVPYWEISKLLGITPSCCHFNSILENWMLVDPDGLMVVDNFKPIVNFVGGDDQVWFFMVNAQTEMDCGPALCGIVEAQQAVKGLDVNAYIAALEKVEKAVRRMKVSLSRMRERCRPWVFYNVIRPYFAGWDSPAFKAKGWKGLIYEGVSPDPLCYGGGSAAQSVTLPSLDAGLGIIHQPEEKNACNNFQKQMLPQHREFVKALADGPSIRHFATFSKNSRALRVYNACLQAVTDFRSYHIQIVTEYVIIPSHQKDINQNFSHQAALGTGGTGFMTFLKNMRSSITNAFCRIDEGTEIN
ncbi:indoleamine 2,3-dioxygenase 2-like [Acanthaster planci]|uniref:Indoleamine 2,3-dioxygenase 2-like n=1 Tax=Acanthaster planci TaxID=133434 RepID=A0A8B7YHG6_ACAPL|nr:indoleamine 2,3-dioxygenase 2-like [Acanthaster planci]